MSVHVKHTSELIKIIYHQLTASKQDEQIPQLLLSTNQAGEQGQNGTLLDYLGSWKLLYDESGSLISKPDYICLGV